MNLLELQSNPAAFRAALLIDTDSGPRPYSEVVDPWQERDFKALDSGWQRAVLGSNHAAKYQRAWLERARGHSKSADLALQAAWALFASRRILSGIAAAGDQDQARLLRNAIARLVYCNPWLGRILEVQNYRVINKVTNSTLDIITSDAPTAYGLTPDFIICDEVTHWEKPDLWEALFSSAPKRASCMLVVITNAGMMDDWQWNTREAVRTDPNWYFCRLDGPVASWITPKLLEEQKRLLPSIAYRRLWLNEWTTGGGDALTREDIDAAFRSELRPQASAESGYEYVGGLDLGVTRDASAVCILGIRRSATGHGRIRLAHTKVWRPTKGQRVDLQVVEDTLRKLHGLFNLNTLNFDPWEARHMASRLQAGGLAVQSSQLKTSGGTSRVPMTEVTATPKNLQTIATVLIEAFNDRRVELYPEPDLHRDLTRLRVEEKNYGFRLVSPRDALGHGDLGTAFGLAMLAASELANQRVIHAGAVSVGRFSSPFQRAINDLELEAERRQLLSDPTADPSVFEWLMFRAGRGPRPAGAVPSRLADVFSFGGD